MLQSAFSREGYINARPQLSNMKRTPSRLHRGNGHLCCWIWQSLLGNSDMLRILIVFSATPWRWVSWFPKFRRNLRTFRASWNNVPTPPHPRRHILNRTAWKTHTSFSSEMSSSVFCYDWTWFFLDGNKTSGKSKGCVQGGIHNGLLWTRSWTFGFHKMWSFFVSRGNVENFKEYAIWWVSWELSSSSSPPPPPLLLSSLLYYPLNCFVIHSFIHSSFIPFSHQLSYNKVWLRGAECTNKSMNLLYCICRPIQGVQQKSGTLQQVIHWVISNVKFLYQDGRNSPPLTELLLIAE
jgi:hypothetical protein